MKKFLALLLSMMTVGVHAADLDIHNIMRLQLPDDFRVVSVDQSLGRGVLDNLYWLGITIRFTFENKYATLDINLYGNGDDRQFQEVAALVNENPNVRQGVSWRAWQPYEEMKKAYDDDPRRTSRGLTFSKYSQFVPAVGADDCHFYFLLNNPYFSEVIIQTKNIWSAMKMEAVGFAGKKIMTQVQEPTRESTLFAKLMDLMMESITFSSEATDIVFNPSLAFKSSDIWDGYYISVQDNVRLRKKPEIQSEYIEDVRRVPYAVIAVGPEVTIKGKKGRWLGVSLEPGKTFGWVFSGAMRKLKESELGRYFNGK